MMIDDDIEEVEEEEVVDERGLLDDKRYKR